MGRRWNGRWNSVMRNVYSDGEVGCLEVLGMLPYGYCIELRRSSMVF